MQLCINCGDLCKGHRMILLNPGQKAQRWRCKPCNNRIRVSAGMEPEKLDEEEAADAFCAMLKTLPDEMMLQAFRNIGFEVGCGACVEIFFCGMTTAGHECRRDPKEIRFSA